MFNKPISILAVIITAFLCNSAWAVTTIYSDRASWLSDIEGGADFQVDFNGYSTDTPIIGTVDLGPFSVQSDSIYSQIDVPPYQFSDRIYGDGTPSLFIFVHGERNEDFTFTFDSSINAFFGNFWANGNTGSPTMMRLSFEAGGTEDLIVGDYIPSPDFRSFGFISDTPVTHVTLFNAINDGFFVDDIEGASIAPIPAPAAIWLFGFGLLGLTGVARRNRP